MIANLDENIGKLRKFLKNEGLSKNTILVLMTDNGTAAGVELDKDGRVTKGYNAGMSGKKAYTFEGGHRVPFFIHWENGGLDNGRDVSNLASFVDFMPTLLDLCHLKAPDGLQFDGASLVPLLKDAGTQWPPRTLFTDTQREEYLIKYKDYCIMTDRWRLLNGRLYDINNDPGEFRDVSAKHPKVLEKLMADYESWWRKVSVDADQINPIPIGSEEVPDVTLTTHDVHVVEGNPAWSQEMVRLGEGANGHWVVEVAKDGRYQFDLHRWPAESGLKINDAAPVGESVPGDQPYPAGKALGIVRSAIAIGGQELHQMLAGREAFSRFTVELKKGVYELECRFADASGVERNAYYVYVSKVKN